MSSHRSPTLALIGLSFLLGACSFTFQAGTSAGTRNRQARHAAQPARTTPAKNSTNPTPASTTKTPSTPTNTPDAPRITGKNVFGNGSIGAFNGKAYVIPNTTTTMPDLSKLVPFASLLTDSFIVQPQTFTEGFPGVLMQDEWFAIRYDGNFDVQKDNAYTFTLASDDGAVLYIDGEKLINNDGLHAAKTMTGNKTLKAGRHSLRLDYFQGNRGPVALALSINDATTEPRPLVGVR